MKIYSSVKPENVKAICTEAHKYGMTITGHIPQGMTVYDGVNDGIDQVNHIGHLTEALLPKDFDRKKVHGIDRLKVMASIDPNSQAGRELVEFLKSHRTVIDDTVSLTEMGLRPVDKPLTDIEPGVAKVAPELREQLTNGGVSPQAAPVAAEVVQKTINLIGALHRGGVTLVAGTDQNVPGYSVYREIELYVEAGFTPLEAIQAATIIPARVMKADAESGTVEPGKRADFAILDANPLDNVHNIRTVHQVVANGVLYESAPLWKSVGFTP